MRGYENSKTTVDERPVKKFVIASQRIISYHLNFELCLISHSISAAMENTTELCGVAM